MYDKDKIKESLSVDDVFSFLAFWDGEPEKNETGIVSRTICHGGNSRKLYYYQNSHLFRCYTECDDSFDIFELVIKLFRINKFQELNLYQAIEYIVNYFHLDDNISKSNIQENESLNIYFDYFNKHNFDLSSNVFNKTELKIYDSNILNKFAYPIIGAWEQEGISREVIKRNKIGYYPVGNQITIPHYDINNNLIGIRGRYLTAFDSERMGKYRPLLVNQILYNHPLSLNLYNLNNSKQNISFAKTAIIFEGEKSCLKYQSYFGKDNDISVACCGSHISEQQISLLESCGVLEIIIAFDRQFQKIGDNEYQGLLRNFNNLKQRYGSSIKISLIFDKHKNKLPYKASPIDCGKEVFLEMLNERIVL